MKMTKHIMSCFSIKTWIERLDSLTRTAEFYIRMADLRYILQYCNQHQPVTFCATTSIRHWCRHWDIILFLHRDMAWYSDCSSVCSIILNDPAFSLMAETPWFLILPCAVIHSHAQIFSIMACNSSQSGINYCHTLSHPVTRCPTMTNQYFPDGAPSFFDLFYSFFSQVPQGNKGNTYCRTLLRSCCIIDHNHIHRTLHCDCLSRDTVTVCHGSLSHRHDASFSFSMTDQTSEPLRQQIRLVGPLSVYYCLLNSINVLIKTFDLQYNTCVA